MESKRYASFGPQSAAPPTSYLQPLTYSGPSTRTFTRHPACPPEITNDMIVSSVLGVAETTTQPDGTVTHTWIAPVYAPDWTIHLPMPPLPPAWPAEIDRAIYAALRRHALYEQAQRTTARHQRRNKARRHR